MLYISAHIILYDEMPHTPQNSDLEHNVIYCYNTDYIGHGVYEDVSKTMQLFNEIEALQSEVFMDTHLNSFINIGHPQNTIDESSIEEACKEL